MLFLRTRYEELSILDILASFHYQGLYFQVLLGGWALIDADIDSSDPLQEDMDTVVMLTRNAYYVADYDEDTDKFTGAKHLSADRDNA